MANQIGFELKHLTFELESKVLGAFVRGSITNHHRMGDLRQQLQIAWFWESEDPNHCH